jgi:serine/threonine protein kinase/uncharacterized protein (DUF342 family)
MATVWRAEQTALDRPVALKVVSPHLVSDPRTRERFLREAKVSARVVHPNVITCHDAGDAGGQLFMALELVTGGDLRQVLTKEGGKLDPWRAVRLVQDCLQGLVAIEDAGLIHRDIKPGNIFLDARGIPKLADLGLAKPTGGAELTMPGMIVGTPAYIAPEQARAVADLDIRADIYALGATLFHLVAGRPPFPGDDPMGVLVQVLNDPLPDLAQTIKDCPAAIAWLTRLLMAKDRNERPANARAALDQVSGVLNGRQQQAARPASQPQIPTPSRTPQNVPAAHQLRAPEKPVTTGVHRPTAGTPATKALSKPPSVNLDEKQLQVLAKRIIVDQGGLRASLALAPGASFPRWMLEQIITAAGVCYGLVEASLHAATFPKDLPRRLVLARGTPPSPGIAGRSVRNEGIDPIALSVSIEISPDQLQATAYTRPGQMARKEDLERGVKETAIRFGIDAEVLKRLVDGPPFPGGRVVVARGRAPDPGRAPGFALSSSIENTTVDALAGAGNLRKVDAGELIAWWDDGVPVHAGMDVLGRRIDPVPHEQTTPERCAGAGTELAREADGRLALRARVAGFVQRQTDGCVRVVGVFSVDGDVGPNDPPIVTDEVVVVRGTVKAGAKITSASDVVIMGDLEDATISAGGSLEVDGCIKAGDNPVEAGGTVVATQADGRTLMAGALRIDGEVRNCELRATGDVRVRKLVGGGITAGGNVLIDIVGDGDGTTTTLWAGHHLTRAEEAKIAELAAKKADAERGKVMRERQNLEAEVERNKFQQSRMQNMAFINAPVAKALQDRLRQLELEAARAAEADETARRTLAQTRQDARRANEKGENARARIEVGIVAHAGVVVRLADGEAEALREPRLKLKLGV